MNLDMDARIPPEGIHEAAFRVNPLTPEEMETAAQIEKQLTRLLNKHNKANGGVRAILLIEVAALAMIHALNNAQDYAEATGQPLDHVEDYLLDAIIGRACWYQDAGPSQEVEQASPALSPTQAPDTLKRKRKRA